MDNIALMIFILLSFIIGFLLGGKIGWKAGYDFYDRNKNVINNNETNKDIKLGMKYPNNFS